jgi:hypothetical protein
MTVHLTFRWFGPGDNAACLQGLWEGVTSRG